MPQAESLELDFRQPEVEPVVIRSSQWRGVQVEFSRLRLPAEYEFAWSGSSHYLALHDLILADGEMIVDDVPPIRGGDLRDKMTYVPAACGLRGWAKPVPRQNTFTVVYFDPEVMEHELQEESAAMELRPLIYFSEPDLLSTMRKLEAAMVDAASPSSTLYAETLGLVAALETFRLQRALSRPEPRPGALTARQERTALEFMEDNLGVDFGLDDLARAVGLSRYHFSRRFKATFGMPPHRFVAERRIERARHMLAQTPLSIADIASGAGFNSTANFIRVFRERHGMTPGDYRRRA